MTLYRPSGIYPRADYDVLLEAAQGCKSALEFGPGHSTYALIEAGCERIWTFENTEKWFTRALAEFEECPQVFVRPCRIEQYVSLAVMFEPAGCVLSFIPEEGFDIAHVDAPSAYTGEKQAGYPRLNTMRFALEHARLVLLHDADREGERRTLEVLESEGHQVEFLEGTKLARVQCNDSRDPISHGS